tara:strand:+ start:159 stop:1232 length:1074 start_codon:yes stop_codon:yes gene_type:complete
MRIEKRKISDLIKAEYNPRKISVVQLQELKDGIEEFGLVSPLVVNENPERKNIIVGGHQRLKIWEELGNKEVDCSIVNLELDKERKLNIKLNKNGGTFDDDLLKEFFDYEELIDWGFTAGELFDQDEKTEGLIDDDEIPEVKESIVVRGDIWKLGEHRVMCGDSTSSVDVEKLMDGEKADMVFTDPPFPNNSEIMHDMIIDIDKAFTNARNYCDNLMIWFWDNISFPEFGEMVTTKHIWHKTNGWQAGHFETMYGYHNDNKRHEQLVFNANSVGINNKRETQGFHLTPKPLELPILIFEKLKFKNFVLDLFLGSGSTLMACEKTNRKCYGMELDEKYCDVIINRWEQFTGNKAEKIL